jgi:thioredoxin reductase (NADPH)
MKNIVIIGSGPAAHTAAIYAARANLAPVMFEGEMAGGIAAGGQLTTTNEIENYPGFVDPISGFELMFKMKEQSIKYGTQIITKTVDKVDLTSNQFKVYYQENFIETKTVIIATGATAKRLGMPGEKELWQKGISACAICDGGLPIFRGKELFVIGGGDTAIEEATYLTNFASKVILLVRRDELRASKIMQNRVKDNPKIEIMWNTVALEAVGKEFLEKLKIKNVKTGEIGYIDAAGLFYAIGHKPNTDFLKNKIDLNSDGYIITKPNCTETNIPGVFACGDVQDYVYRQAIVAAGSGAMASLDAERFIVENYKG